MYGLTIGHRNGSCRCRRDLFVPISGYGQAPDISSMDGKPVKFWTSLALYD